MIILNGPNPLLFLLHLNTTGMEDMTQRIITTEYEKRRPEWKLLFPQKCFINIEVSYRLIGKKASLAQYFPLQFHWKHKLIKTYTRNILLLGSNHETRPYCMHINCKK